MKNRFDTATTIRRILIVSLFLIVLLMTGLGISCQSGGTTPPAISPGLPKEPTPGTQPATPPSEGWSADGVVDRAEYLGEMNYGNYEIYWSSDTQYIYIAVKSKTTGWVAVGIQPGSRMKNADIILGFVKEGEAYMLDLFSTGDFGPHPPDTELGGTFDIIDFGGKEADGYTIIEFKRALDTGDQYDNKLSNGNNRIIWSYGSVDEYTMQHANRGYGEITLPE